MPTTTTTKISNARKYITFPFDFKGNAPGCKVALCSPSRGDGEIYTGHGGRRFAQVSANIFKKDANYLRLILTYTVWELGWNTTKKQDALYFTAVYDYPMRQYNIFQKAKVDEVTTQVTTQYWNLENQEEAYYMTSYNTESERHSYMKVSNDLHVNQSRQRSWLPPQKLYFKIDDSGNELKKYGNIGVRGEVRLYVNLTKTVTTTVQQDVPVYSRPGKTAKKGSNPKLDNIPTYSVRNVLGFGYDISKLYADGGSCTISVLDLNALNEDQHIRRDTQRNSRSVRSEGSSLKEINSSIANELQVNLSAGFKGFAFKAETKNNFKVTKHEKFGNKFISVKDTHVRERYIIDYANSPERLYDYLQGPFLTALDESTPDWIIRNYGTHVILGEVLGARLVYDMRSRTSLIENSQARSFSSKVGFKFTPGGTKLQGGAKKLSEKDIFLARVNDILENTSDSKLIEALAELSQSFKATKPAASGGSGSNGIDFGTSSSSSSEYSSSLEENSVYFETHGVGGRSELCSQVSTNPEAYGKWIDSIDKNITWSDFVPGTLVPIWKFVPAGHKVSAQMLKNAMENYLASGGSGQDTLGTDVAVCRATLKNKQKTVNVFRDKGESTVDDNDICTQSRKATGWKVTLEVINLENGRIGIAVAYQVKEGANWQSDRTHLMLRDVVDVTENINHRCVIRPNIKTVWESPTFRVVGQLHGWIDVTHLLLDCPFIKTSERDRVRIKIDGGGEDRGNIGFEATFVVPYAYYKDEVAYYDHNYRE